MTPLRDHIRKNGFDYHKVKEVDNGFIYRQDDNGKTVAFEVFKRKHNLYYQCESFPGNEAFGVWAWTYRNLEEAEKRLSTF